MSVQAIDSATATNPATEPSPEEFEQAVQEAAAKGTVNLLGQNMMRMLTEALSEAQPED